MDIQNLFATVIAAMTLASALMVVLSRNAIYAAFFLLLTLLGVAVEYAILNAHFLAVIQILVYAGAVVVLIVFVLMMMGFGRGGFQGFLPAGRQIALSVGLLVLLLGAGGLGGLLGEPLRPAPIASPSNTPVGQPSPKVLRPALQGAKPHAHPPFLASAEIRTQPTAQENFGSVRTVGAYFITHNALIFELISVLLLMAIMGVMVLLRGQQADPNTNATVGSSRGASSSSV